MSLLNGVLCGLDAAGGGAELIRVAGVSLEMRRAAASAVSGVLAM
jgi:hypothetical protein